MQQQDRKTQPTILLVEDDDDTRRVYGVMLRHAGFHVVEAATGTDAVASALEQTPEYGGWRADGSVHGGTSRADGERTRGEPQRRQP